MRLRLSRSDIAFIVLAVVALAALVFGLFGARATSPPLSVATVTSTDNVIVRENALMGTNSWLIPGGKEATTQIQAYASATSVLPGQTLTFYVSTQTEGTPCSIGIYRLGWYEGFGGRLKALQTDQIGHAQGYYDTVTHRLVGCSSCHVDPQTGLVEAHWQPSYWQMRFEPDSAGTLDRTIVCYRVETAHNDLARDPLYGKDNIRVTAQWRDPVLARPENALIGIMYSGYESRQRGFPWQVSSQAKSPLLDGTGLQAGQSYGCGLVGYEWDRIFANGATPPVLLVLAVSHTTDVYGDADVSNTTYYIASSGAMVFATGSIYWTASLDSYRFDTDEKCIGQNPVVPGMQKLMAHVMDALVINHPLQRLALTSTVLEI